MGPRSQPSSGDGNAGLSPAIVVESALRLMDQRGVEWLSMRKLAAELGVSAQALYWYFPSKDALCRAVVAAAGAELGAVDLGTGTPLDRLERYLRGLREHWRAHPSVIALGRRYPPTAAGAVAAQGAALLEELGFDPAVSIERLRALVWVVLGFAYVEQGVSESIHHQPVDAALGRFQVHVGGVDDTGEHRELDTEALFGDVLRTVLAGLVTELR